MSILPSKTQTKQRKDDNLLSFLDEPAIPPTEKYGPTKIKINQHYEKPKELRNHPIQRMFDAYNELVRIIFLQKQDYEKRYNDILGKLLKLFKRLGITLMKGQLKPDNLKSREQSNALKEKIFMAWCRVLSDNNQYNETTYSTFAGKVLNENQKSEMEHNDQILATYQAPEQKQILHYYKCFVGKGNNAMLVRSLFKSRYWWTSHDKEEPEKVNFLWTQCRKNTIM